MYGHCLTKQYSFPGDPYKRVGLFDDTEPPDADNTLGYLSDQHLSDSVSLSDDSTFTGEHIDVALVHISQ